MLQSKTIAALAIIICAIFTVSWFSKPSLEDRVQAKCEKQAFRYMFVKDVYDREVRVCKEITLKKMNMNK